MGNFYECPYCNKSGLSIPLENVKDPFFDCPMCLGFYIYKDGNLLFLGTIPVDELSKNGSIEIHD